MLKIALNQKTCENLDFFKFIKYSKGFYGVELDFNKLSHFYSKNMSLKDILELLENYNLEVVSIFQLEDFSLCSAMDYKTKILSKLNQMIEYLYKLESNLLIVNPSSIKGQNEADLIPKWKIIRRTQNRLEKISKIANETDVNIGFEFISSPESSISTLEEAKEVMKNLVDKENLGYILDLFHLTKSNVDLNQLYDIKSYIFLIQLCDVKFDSLEQLITCLHIAPR